MTKFSGKLQKCAKIALEGSNVSPGELSQWKGGRHFNGIRLILHIFLPTGYEDDVSTNGAGEDPSSLDMMGGMDGGGEEDRSDEEVGFPSESD